MPIVYDGTGGLFTRLGKLFQLKKIINTFRADLRTEIDDVIAVYADADKRLIGSLITRRESLDRTIVGLDSVVDSACRITLMEQIKDGLVLQPRNLGHALRLLVDDMRTTNTKTVGGSSVTQSVHIDAASVSTTVTAVSVTSNAGTILVSTKVPMNQLGTGTQQEKQCLRVETMRVDCVADESNQLPAGKEIFAFTGKEFRNRQHYEWPLGSGTSRRVHVTRAADGGSSVPSNNILDNSGFDIWTTTSACQSWTADSTRASGSYSTGGVGGSSNPIERQATNFSPDGEFSLEFNGDGNEKHRLYQKLGTIGGSKGRVKPLKTYIVSFRIRSTSGTISSGVLKASLTNGSYADISTATVTRDFSSANLTDSAWVHMNAVWQTDATDIVPDSRFVIQFTTALENAKSVLVDELVLAEPTPLYRGGPEVLIVRGSADFRNEDRFTLAVANDRAGEMQNFFDQVFDTCNMNLTLPLLALTA